MKKFLVLILAAFVGISAVEAKPSKAFKKMIKEYKAEGWVVPIGNQPLENQISRSLEFQEALDENGENKYVIGDAMSIGENFDAAKFQAMELVKIDIASKLSSDITQLIDNQVANKQLSQDEAASLTQTVSGGKSLISAKLGRLIQLVAVYREKPNKNKEVRVVCAYSTKKAKEAALATIRETLEDKSGELSGKVDKLLGL